MLSLALPTRRATVRAARALAAALAEGDVVVLEGPLGAGKTFFTRAVCRGLGVPVSVPIQSPSFALVHEHGGGRLPIAHADLYRLVDAGEIEELGLDEQRRRGVLLVEWGARFGDALGRDRLELSLDRGVERGRRLEAKATGPRSERLVGALAAAPLERRR